MRLRIVCVDINSLFTHVTEVKAENERYFKVIFHAHVVGDLRSKFFYRYYYYYGKQ